MIPLMMPIKRLIMPEVVNERRLEKLVRRVFDLKSNEQNAEARFLHFSYLVVLIMTRYLCDLVPWILCAIISDFLIVFDQDIATGDRPS